MVKSRSSLPARSFPTRGAMSFVTFFIFLSRGFFLNVINEENPRYHALLTRYASVPYQRIQPRIIFTAEDV